VVLGTALCALEVDASTSGKKRAVNRGQEERQGRQQGGRTCSSAGRQQGITTDPNDGLRPEADGEGLRVRRCAQDQRASAGAAAKEDPAPPVMSAARDL
jgi:hypothetical protein